jgi:hypothetical protein
VPSPASRRHGVRRRRGGREPIVSIDDLAQPDLWESEQEYQDFLADLYATRHADIA